MIQTEKEKREKVLEQRDRENHLILHNDDVNTFDHVVDVLCEVCEHNLVQAEQCAMLAHYKGKCHIKSGSFKEMNKLKELMFSEGLTVTID